MSILRRRRHREYIFGSWGLLIVVAAICAIEWYIYLGMP